MVIDGKLVKNPILPEDKPPVVQDDLFNYSACFLKASMDLLQLNELIRAGDIKRLTVTLKRLIPSFVGLTSPRSKYAIECINFLTKTESLLSEKQSVRVKLGAFVNSTGRRGHKKAADMQQENCKLVKTVIRALGASKTDKAIERSSKAACVLSDIWQIIWGIWQE
ncbi:uncharacterized protein LOC144356547 [Saccoglossus kowalevskii]